MTIWEHQKIALAPQDHYDQLGCFSGSAHFENEQLYLYYTGNTQVQTQCLAVSNNFQDFEKFIGNPFINTEHIPEHIDPAQLRDPKFIQKDGFNYLLLGALTKNGHGTIAVFKGQTLTDFEYQFSLGDETHRIGTMWECPDLMTLDQQDVLIFSPQYTDRDPQHDMPNLHSAVYSVGAIDLEHQTCSLNGFHLIDQGFDFYAPQTLQDQEGRRILIAWMDMWESDNVTHRLEHGWSGCMTYPRELSLENKRLIQRPARELDSLRQLKSHLDHLKVNSQQLILSPFPVYDAVLKITAASKAVYTLIFHNTMTLTHDPASKHLLINRNGQQRQLHYDKEVLELRILSDVSSVELFICFCHSNLTKLCRSALSLI